MKKILAFMLTLITLAMLCSSCAGNVNNPGKFFSDDIYDSDYVWNSADVVSALAGKTEGNSYGSSSTDLTVFEKDGETSTEVVVYNITKNATVHSFSVKNEDSYTVEFFNAAEHSFFTVVLCEGEEDEYTTSLYDKNGSLVATAEGFHGHNYYLGADEKIAYEANLIRFDNAIYKLDKDGAFKTVKEKSAFTPILPDFDYYNEKYYIDVLNGEEILVYDKSLELVSHWKSEYMLNDNVSLNIFVLNNGNCLVQMLERLPDDAAKYTYIDEDGIKYVLKSSIVNPKNGSEKSVKLKFVVALAYGLDLNGGVNNEICIDKKYDNLAMIAYIKDQKVCQPCVVTLTNRGNVEYKIFADLPLFDAESFNIECVAKGVFAYETITGTTMFVNAKGKKIMELDEDDIDAMNNQYIVADGAIYDYSFKKLYDFEADELSYYDDLSDSILLKNKDGDIYLYTNGNKTMIWKADTNSFWDDFDVASSRYYYISDYDTDTLTTTHTYYNAKGEKLFSATGSQPSKVVDNYEGAALFKTYDSEGNTVYYRVSK